MKTVLQVVLGIALTIGVATLFLYTTLPIFWEVRYPDGSYPITWRSGLVFLIVLAVAQLAAFFLVRRRGKPARQ